MLLVSRVLDGTCPGVQHSPEVLRQHRLSQSAQRQHLLAVSILSYLSTQGYLWTATSMTGCVQGACCNSWQIQRRALR